MLLYENRKLKLLNTLKIGINPFKKFVSTGEIQEKLGLVQSRNELIESIKEIIEKNENFILPIIGGVGVGKTHLFWALKEKMIYYNTTYISLENVYRKFYYNSYSEFIENLGVDPLRFITNQLCNEWGALEKKFGFFHIVDIEKVRKNAFERLSEKFEDKVALIDVINAITAHQLDPYKKIEAENWLLGELMDVKDLTRLNLMHDLRNKNNAYSMLKILIENSKLGTILFIDDCEKIISIMKPEIETEEIFDPSWIYGDEASIQERDTAQKILEQILRLQDIRGLKIIITLKSVDSLEEIKKTIQEKNKNLLLTFKSPLFLLDFVESDIYQFYKASMKEFLKSINYIEFLTEFPDSYFPLNEEILRQIYSCSQGNPRECIKMLIKIFNEIIYTDEKLENIICDYENLI